MYLHTVKERLSFLRKLAKEKGLTFKEVNLSYAGNQAYALFSRKTGEQVSSDDTLCGWYDKQMHYQIFDEYKA